MLASLLLAGIGWTQIAAQEVVANFDPPQGSRRTVIGRAVAPAGLPDGGLFKSGEDMVHYQRVGNEVVWVIPEGVPTDGRTFVSRPYSVGARVFAEQTGGKVALSIREKPVFTYQGEPMPLPRPDIKPVYRRGGYLHPIYSPGGRMVTDDYPPNHVHHHGVWFPWTKTIFEERTPDFWNMGEGKGRVEFVSLLGAWSGEVAGGLAARHQFVDMTTTPAKVALEETWHITAYDSGGSGAFVFDLVSTQRCASASALRLPTYHYGGLGFRGNRGWDGTNNCFFLTSNGETNRVTGNETRGRWCHIGGEVDGKLAGVAILCHPDNFRAPQPMRLHPSEPFFCFAPSQLGEWSILPGQPYVSRYRFVVMDGPPNRALLDSLWEDYAKPPSAKITVR